MLRTERKVVESFQTTILNWYRQYRRRLPWRDTRDPYKIMVAEFLLQKTDVEKVKVIYDEFIFRWPTVQALAKEQVPSIAKAIQILGLRYKATRLKSTAKAVMEKFGGKIPEAEKELLTLPGVGRYIACAVECFAYNKPRAVVDTNVVRILSRVFRIRSQRSRPRDDARLWQAAQALVPHKNVRQYNWALIDLGGLVCKTTRPLCGECVLEGICMFRRSGSFARKEAYEKARF